MNYGHAFLGVMSIGYLGAAAAYWHSGNKGYGVALFCYAIANVGLIYAAK